MKVLKSPETAKCLMVFIERCKNTENIKELNN